MKEDLIVIFNDIHRFICKEERDICNKIVIDITESKRETVLDIKKAECKKNNEN